MPYLVNPGEIKSPIGDREVGIEMPQTCRRLSSIPSDTDTTSMVNPAEIQEMILRRDVLIEQVWLSSDIDAEWRDAVSNIYSQISIGEGFGESEEERCADRRRAGGGDRHQPAGRWQPVQRQRGGILSVSR